MALDECAWDRFEGLPLAYNGRGLSRRFPSWAAFVMGLHDDLLK